MIRTTPSNGKQERMVRADRKSLNIRGGGKSGPEQKFSDEMLRQTILICMLGATDLQIAEFFQVCPATISYWKNHRPEWKQAMMKGKIEFDMKVVHSLGQRALGYDYVEKEITTGTDRSGKPTTTTKTHHKQQAPDVTACIFWLKNRQREHWTEVTKHEFEANIHLQKKIDITVLTKQQQLLLKEITVKQLIQNDR